MRLIAPTLHRILDFITVALFGGPIRDRIPVYWSHFGTYRVRSAALMGVPCPPTPRQTSPGFP